MTLPTAQALTGTAGGSSSTDGSVWAARADASQAAYNTRPTAPEHIGMVNGLLAGGDYAADTNLSTALSDVDRKKLKAHLKHAAQRPTHVCFQVHTKSAHVPNMDGVHRMANSLTGAPS